MKLEALLKAAETLDFVGNPDCEITGLSYDSRKVGEGHCFFCIRGYQTDGRLFAVKAAEAGAAAVVYDEYSEALDGLAERGTVLIRTEDCREALGRCSAAFYGEPSRSLLMTGVTGTNGKTSITHLLSDLMEQQGHLTAVFGTIANRVGDAVIPASVTTPESLELNEMLALAREKGVGSCAMEVSSHAVALKRVAGLHFDYGIFTNLTKDHLDFHQTMEAYFEAKAAFFALPEKGLILNADDPYGQQLIGRFAGGSVPVVSYGIDQPADLKASDAEMTAKGSRFSLHWKGEVATVHVPIPGRIYIYNIMAALAVLLMEGVPLETAAAAAAQVKPLRGRLEPVPNDKDITVLIDYAHTPDGLENAIRSARIFTTGRLITVFGCGGDRDRTKRPQMGEISARLSDYSYVTSDNPRTEEPMAIISEILPGMSGAEGRYTVEPDRGRAIAAALDAAVPGDTVLIAGKGHETYQIIGKNRIHFDDREEALNWFQGGRS